ncbi:peptide deformylase [Cellulomonas composti]|uniref:Peptide deformylase n=1 Tax=Cellulomonas composti TaxID=266130 RepID=A0A511J900_9CELL|nr:peptide deformylase [Cellulomonas composti]GEL94470.1 peptide deformylase 1 [Cellulomonas composti]
MTSRDQQVRELVLRLLDGVGEGVASIVRAGHPVLRGVALPYDAQLSPDELTALVSLMRRTMRAAPGVGLAAPQLGLPLALAVVEDPGVASETVAEVRERAPLPFRVLVNPAYEPALHAERAAFYEGCLSVPGLQAVVGRWRAVRLTGSDETGAALDEIVTGWSARIVQHETDHLGGTLYLDRAELRSLAAADQIGLRWTSEPRPEAASAALGFVLPT